MKACLVFTWLSIVSVASAFSQTPAALWTGQVQCQLNFQVQDYTLQETQTWTVVGAPFQDNGVLVYPAKWTSQSQGGTQRQLGINTLAGQWVGNVAPMDDVLIIAVRPSDNRLVIRRWHLPLQASGAISGAKQTATPSGTPNRSTLSLPAYQWPLPIIEDSATSTNVVGTGTISVAGNLMPLHSPDAVTGNCQWHFTKGNNQRGASVDEPSNIRTPIAPIAGNLQTPTNPSGANSTTSSISPPNNAIAVAPTSTIQRQPTNADATPVSTATQPPLSNTTVSSLKQPLQVSMVAAITEVTPAGFQEVKHQTPPTNFPVNITGKYSHFDQATTKVDLGLPSYATVASVTVNSTTSLTAYVNFTTAPFSGSDHYSGNVTVTTGSEVLQLNGGFTLTVPTQFNSIAQVSPATGQQGQQMSVTITGQYTNFANGSTTLILTDNSIWPGRVTVNSPTSATVSFTVLPSTPIAKTNLSLMTQTSDGPEQVFGSFSITPMLSDSYGSSQIQATSVEISNAAPTRTFDGQLPYGKENWFQLNCEFAQCTISLPNMNAQFYPPPGPGNVPWKVVAEILDGYNQSTQPMATIGGQGSSQTTLPGDLYYIHVRVSDGTQSRYRLIVNGNAQ